MLFVHDHKFVEYEKKIYTLGSLNNQLFKRYENIFGEVTIIANKVQALKPGSEDDKITDKQLFLFKKKDILGIKKFKTIHKLLKSEKHIVLRLPSINGCIVGVMCLIMRKKYIVEVVGCAKDSFNNHGLIGKLIAPFITFGVRFVTKRATGALYVTKEFLQKRYPCKNKTVGVSDVFIAPADEDIINKRLEKIEHTDLTNITLATAAAVNVRYKGQEYVIKAIPELKKRGIHAKYVMMGAGDNSYLLGVAKKYGVEENVVFTGKLNYSEVMEQLDECDIYIQPSLQEGLPRAVVEAMSRGCPCIGAKTGGIPELLNYECITKPKSIVSIVDAIESICNKEKLKQLAKTNFEKSYEFEENALNKKRNDYYNKIKKEMLRK